MNKCESAKDKLACKIDPEVYFTENDAPYYPADIDNYALKYFGPSQYHSDEFRQEAYLFVPFDEHYDRAMSDDDPIMSAYSYARRIGIEEGFIPILIRPDGTLLECLVMNADLEHKALGKMKSGYDNCRFSGYWDSDSHMTDPFVLAKIPVKNP